MVARFGFDSQNQKGMGTANDANKEEIKDLSKPVIGCALTVANSFGVRFR
jgi:hypothetical protein